MNFSLDIAKTVIIINMIPTPNACPKIYPNIPISSNTKYIDKQTHIIVLK